FELAIKGTDIVKRLPEGGKKNCKECGLPTCFAFAMKLASGGIALDKCPYIDREVRGELEDALAPPIRPVTIGSGAGAFVIGDETVLYRHEKTFVHQPGIAVLIADDEADKAVEEKIEKLKELHFSWVGKSLRADLLALQNKSGDRSIFTGLVKKALSAADCPLMLISEDTDALLAAHEICAERRPLLYPVTAQNLDKVVGAVKGRPAPVAVRSAGVESLVPITSRLRDAGIEDILLDPGSKDMHSALRDQTLIRRAALKQGFRLLGYPTIALPCFMTADKRREMLLAAMFIPKYAGIIVLSDINEHTLLPLLVQRLNIYTDPRMPMSMEEKVYAINDPDSASPVLVTTNWALTYFIVASEIEASKVPSWLCVKETGGLGVLTAWAAGKFSGDSIAPFIRKCGVEGMVKHRKLVIPGKVARIRNELTEALPDWEIIVGPGDANDIPAYLPGLVKSWKG
ncbi:MAG: acetyl-CoA decarbonylase/synthase complex subunit gamma, partial [Dehalococcoidia bacterium]|nr:acetyl-CoA decarbonylase/synthase complex subunit gamma [Dehalococcoidia bacterium]